LGLAVELVNDRSYVDRRIDSVSIRVHARFCDEVRYRLSSVRGNLDVA
jgi:hypothetical protein